jgi:transcriptional regulator with XRE-family HTH domain
MDADEQLYARRLGFWLKAARERSGKSQQGAAEFLGFSSKSKSTISDYENGVTIPALRMLKRLAEWYGLPLETFTEPDPTPEERLDEISRLAVRREQRDWAEGIPKSTAAPKVTPKPRATAVHRTFRAERHRPTSPLPGVPRA